MLEYQPTTTLQRASQCSIVKWTQGDNVMNGDWAFCSNVRVVLKSGQCFMASLQEPKTQWAIPIQVNTWEFLFVFST